MSNTFKPTGILDFNVVILLYFENHINWTLSIHDIMLFSEDFIETLQKKLKSFPLYLLHKQIQKLAMMFVFV